MGIKTNNNFGALRLVFASLVILSHSPEIIDGNRSREVLSKVFGTISFGDLSVDCFFLISGYLISKSFYSTNSIRNFIVKRILRIYPGFIVASIISICVFAPLSIGWALISNIQAADWLKSLLKMATLDPPYVEGVFRNAKHPELNGSMWTIMLEFLCYLSIPIFYKLGLNKRKYYFLTVLFCALIFVFIIITKIANHFHNPFFVYHFSRLLTAFLVGGAFYHYSDIIIWNKKISIACFIALCISLTHHLTSEFGLFTFGGYLLFNFALNFKNKFLNSVGTTNDISYGVYLYAWPFQNLIVQYFPTISPWVLTCYTLLFTIIIGYLSWLIVEKPFMQMKKFFN